MEKVKAALFDAKLYDIESFEHVNNEFGFDIHSFKDRLTPKTVKMANGYEVVIAFVNDQINSAVINELKLHEVKLVALRSAGYNNVDLKAAFNTIHVVRVPAYSPHAVAEHAVALMLALNRKTHKSYFRTRDNNFTLNGLLGFDMAGKTAGVVGTGKIGRTLIRILKGFDMTVLAYDLYPDEQYAKEAAFSYVELDDLYKRSDIISLNCPLSKETYHMVNKESLQKMKDSVMLINTGRGQLIDTKALIDALKSKKVGCAGLDVYEEESEYFFEDWSNSVMGDDILARLLSFQNVLITSHQGFFTHEALHNIAQTTLQNIKDFVENKPLKNEICYKCDRPECMHKKTGRCF